MDMHGLCFFKKKNTLNFFSWMGNILYVTSTIIKGSDSAREAQRLDPSVGSACSEETRDAQSP